MVRRILLVTVIFGVVALSAFANGESEKTALPTPEGFSSVTEKGITLQWKVDGQNLNVRLAADTTGWIAVGFDPSNRMKDANFIIGYVSDGQLFISDDYGTAVTAHSPDEDLGGSNDIIEAEGSEEGGSTLLSFTIPLDSGDQYDRKLEPGKSYKVILASGKPDDFKTYHGSSRASVEIEL